MNRILVSGILGLAVIILLTMSAQAEPKGSNLHGEYSLIGTRTCVQHSTPDTNFVGTNYALGSAGTTRTAHYNGVLKLYGNGTGHFSNKTLQINHNLTGANFTPSGGFSDDCDVEYHAEDGAIKLDFNNCVSTASWPNPPNVITVSSTESGPLSVTVSANGDTLLMSNVGSENPQEFVPDVETTWTCGINASSGLQDCNIQVNKFYRICARSFTAIRLSPKP